MRHPTLTLTWSRHAWFAITAWAVYMAVASVAYPYQQNPDTQKLEESLTRVQQWKVHKGDLVEQLSDTRLLARAGATQAIPALKDEFAFTKETWLKLAIASALIRLGDKDQVYWDFLADEARAAVESDAPSIFLRDSEGRVDRNQRELPPEFIAWAKAHNLNPATAAQLQTFELPRNLFYLAETGDPRSRELLRMGLKSHNTTIQSYAAKGLAKLRDKESVPLIIEAGRTMPREVAAFLVAPALLFFDDPMAQSAAEMFVPDKRVLEELRTKIRAKGADPFLY